SIHSGTLFKQDGFAFHNGHSGLRTDISQTKYGAAISYNRYAISLDRAVSSDCLIFGDGLAASSDPRRIGAGEVITVAQGNLGFRLMFAAEVHKKGTVGNISDGSALQGIYGCANFVTVCTVANITRDINGHSCM